MAWTDPGGGSVVDFYTSQCLPDGSRCLRVTSPYGYRTHPITGEKGSFHGGIDFGGGWRWRNFPVRTPAAGTVVYTGYHNSYGKRVILRMDNDPQKNQLLFAHLNTIDVKVGDKLQRGDSVGGMGTTGDSTGKHLHLEVRKPPRNSTATPYQSDRWGDPAKYDFSREVAGGMSRKTHTVVSGDYIAKITKQYGITQQQLIDWNKDRYPDIGTGSNSLVKVGWVLFVEPDWKIQAQELEKQLNDAKKAREAVEKLLKAEKERADELEAELEAKAAKIQELKGQLETAQEAAAIAQETANDMKERLNKKADKLEITRIALVATERELAEAEKQLAKYQNYIKVEANWQVLVDLLRRLVIQIFSPNTKGEGK